MTVTTLRTTMQVLLRLSRQPFNREPVATHRVLLRHGGAGQKDMLSGALPSRANAAVHLNAGVAAPRLACHLTEHKNEPFDSVGRPSVLAFGVRLIC